MKNISLLSVFIINLSLALFSTGSIAKEPALIAPEIDVTNIALETLTFTGAQIILTLAVINPNARDITVEKIDYQLIINNNPSIRGTITQQEIFPAKKTRSVNVPAVLYYDEQLPVFLDAIQRPTASYRIKGNVTVKEEINALAFDHEGKLALTK